MTWNNHAAKTTSKKIVLAWIQCSKRPIEWTLHSGSVYKREDFFTTDILVGGSSYTEINNASLSSGEWYYNPLTKTLYIRMLDDSDPSLETSLRADYRLFFANTPMDLPCDLSTGEVVHYEALLQALPQAKYEIESDDLVGIAVESSGTISFNNANGFFDDKFDKLFFENKEVRVFSYSKDGTRNLFKGLIQNKSYSPILVKFQLKDFLYKLRDNSFGNIYTDADGTFNNDVIGKYKRIIYGKTTGLKIQSLDQIVSGVSGTGTVSGTNGSAIINGSGTNFLTELSKDDLIIIDEIEYTVDSITNNAQLTLSEDLEVYFSNKTFLIKSDRPQSNKNRTFLVSGSKLSSPSTTVSAVIYLNRITLTDSTDFFINDRILIGSEYGIIKSINDNTIALKQNLDSIPAIGSTVTRSPILNLYFNSKKIPQDYWTVTNTTECKITFSTDMEMKITKVKKQSGSVTFTSGSNSVSIASGNFDNLRPRDFLKTTDTSHSVWYEILEITDETNLKLRTNYTGTTTTCYPFLKSVEYLKDDSIVLADCYGKEDINGNWIYSAPYIIKDILNSIGITNINSSSFDNAHSDLPYIIDLKLPTSSTGSMPTARDIITLLNKTVLGNLTIDEDFNLNYHAYDAQVMTALDELKDEDILNYSIDCKSNIIKTMIGRYRHFDADIYTLVKGSSASQVTSDFVTNYIGTAQTKNLELYLYNESQAQEIIERYLMLFSLSSNDIRINSSLNLSKYELNDKIIVNFRRLYDRFGSSGTTKKIYLITSINRNGTTTNIVASDVGNTINRVARITEDSANDFDNSTENEKIINGFIVDDNELPSSSEDEFGSNLIG